MAGAVGIEPTLAVLETAVLPLYEAPTTSNYSLLMGLLVNQLTKLAEIAGLRYNTPANLNNY